jgi:hypothetical protein
MTYVTTDYSAVTLVEIAAALQASWVVETSSDPEHWTPENPAWGQCAVTALVVQDYLGGSLLRAEAPSTSHYWNLLPSGDEVDLTIGQFGDDVDLRGTAPRSREQVLAHVDTMRRYARLASRVGPTLTK